MPLMVATSDFHLDAYTSGFCRYDDLDRAVTEVEDRCIAAKASVFAFVGDLCDPDTQRCHRAVARAVRCAVRLRAAGVASVWVPGNHDVVEDGTGAHVLLPLAELGGCVSVVSAPEAGYLPALDAFVVVLPFTPASHRYDPAEFVRAAAAQYAESGKGRPVVFLSHLTSHEVLQPTRGSESTEMARGRGVELPLGVIEELFPGSLVVQGHFHRRVTIQYGSVEVIVPGSLERLRFDEEDNTPGWVEVRT